MTKQYVFLFAVAKIKPGLAWICVSSVANDVQELLKNFFFPSQLVGILQQELC